MAKSTTPTIPYNTKYLVTAFPTHNPLVASTLSCPCFLLHASATNQYTPGTDEKNLVTTWTCMLVMQYISNTSQR